MVERARRALSALLADGNADDAHLGLRRRAELRRTTTSCHRGLAAALRRLAPPSDHPDLLAVAKDRYRVVDEGRFPASPPSRPTKVVFGAERRVVVTHSDELHDKQAPGLRPDPRQGAPPARRAAASASPGQDPQAERQRRGRDRRRSSRPRWVSPGALDDPRRRRPRRAATQLLDGPGRPTPLSKTRSSASGSCSPTSTQDWPRSHRSSPTTAPRGRRGATSAR